MNRYPSVVKCLMCRRVLVSFDRHDYKTCGCPNQTMVDGGEDYLRCGGKSMALVEILRITPMPKSRVKKS